MSQATHKTIFSEYGWPNTLASDIEPSQAHLIMTSQIFLQKNILTEQNLVKQGKESCEDL